MKAKIFSLLSMSLAMLFIVGCASIVSKSNWPVSFTSTPSEAGITVKDEKGSEVFKGKTPTIVTLPSSTGYFSGARYTVLFEKENYDPLTIVMERELNGWYIGNILFGGLIGMLIVDPATGAMWKLPENLHGNLPGKKTSLILGDQEFLVVFLEDVPEELRGAMIRIK